MRTIVHGTVTGYNYGCRCDDCRRAKSAWTYEYRRRPGTYERSSAGRQRRRTKHLQRAYGLTPAAYDALVAAQGGACAICRQVIAGTLHVDHDHETGQVRGLLCFDCNTAIAKLGDSLGGVLAAADYLIRALLE